MLFKPSKQFHVYKTLKEHVINARFIGSTCIVVLTIGKVFYWKNFEVTEVVIHLDVS